jgi:hypothetical protein
MTSKTNQTTEEADTSASVAEPGAPVASRKARSKKGASPKKSVAKAGKTAAKRPPTKAAANRPTKAADSKRTPKDSKKTVPPIAVENVRPPQAETKGGKILALIGRQQGASLTELREATGWQAHSVRGFLSIAGKKHNLKIASVKNAAGERIYTAAR